MVLDSDSHAHPRQPHTPELTQALFSQLRDASTLTDVSDAVLGCANNQVSVDSSSDTPVSSKLQEAAATEREDKLKKPDSNTAISFVSNI